MPGDRIELDLHRLELRFADSRLVEPRAVARLAESIERCGQIVPCIVVAAPGLSTRELQCWFEHYQQTLRTAREHMVNRPRLFIDTLQANTARHAGARLRKRVATLRPLPAPLIAAAPRLRTAIDALTRELEREDTHDPDRDPRRGARPANAGARPARDQPPAGDVAQYGAADPA